MSCGSATPCGTLPGCVVCSLFFWFSALCHPCFLSLHRFPLDETFYQPWVSLVPVDTRVSKLAHGEAWCPHLLALPAGRAQSHSTYNGSSSSLGAVPMISFGSSRAPRTFCPGPPQQLASSIRKHPHKLAKGVCPFPCRLIL